MSQLTFDFGLDSSAARRAATQHQKSRSQQNNNRAAVQLRSQTLLHQERSQKKTQSIRFHSQSRQITFRCQPQPAIPHNPPQNTLEGLNESHTELLPGPSIRHGNFRFRCQDPTQRPTFDIYDLYSTLRPFDIYPTMDYLKKCGPETVKSAALKLSPEKTKIKATLERHLNTAEEARIRHERKVVEELCEDIMYGIRCSEEQKEGEIDMELLLEALDDVLYYVQTEARLAFIMRIACQTWEHIYSPLSTAVRYGDLKAVNELIYFEINKRCGEFLKSEYCHNFTEYNKITGENLRANSEEDFEDSEDSEDSEEFEEFEEDLEENQSYPVL